MDARNFKTSSSKSTYSDFSAMSAYSNKSRDYYFLSPSYRSAGAPTPSNHADLYLSRERQRQIRNPSATSPACPCSRSRSLEDVRTEVVTEWEDDDENGNRIVAPATKFNRTTYKTNPSFEKQNFLTRHSMENLIDRSPQVPPPKRISAFQVIEQLSTETAVSLWGDLFKRLHFFLYTNKISWFCVNLFDYYVYALVKNVFMRTF